MTVEARQVLTLRRTVKQVSNLSLCGGVFSFEFYYVCYLVELQNCIKVKENIIGDCVAVW